MMTTPPALRAVLLGDSSNAIHHGCEQLLENWLHGLRKAGISVLARDAGPHWRQKPALLAALRTADLLVINAEGGMHHNRYIAERMIEAAEFAAQHGRPAYLINCTWQANAPTLAKRAAVFRRIYVRESFSQQELAAAGLASQVVPDLTLASPPATSTVAAPRCGWLVSDSAMAEVTAQLYRLTRQLPQTQFAPIISASWRQKPRARKRRLQWLWAKLLGPVGLCPARYLSLVLALPDPAAYLAQLARAEAVLAGRFHTVCFALLTETPFLAVPANTHKIEGLVHDAGLRPDRIVSMHDLQPDRIRAALASAAFSPTEQANLRAFLQRAQAAICMMFAEIAADAQARKDAR